MPNSLLRRFAFNRIGTAREDLLVGPGIGEDAAVISFGDEVAVISSDPITGANINAGWIGVHVACNDIAATGAAPIGVLVTLLLPPEDAIPELDRLTAEIHRAANELGIAILGGHSEVTVGLTKSIICMTALGRAPVGGYVTSNGAQIGDEIIMTKSAAIEGTAILATDFAGELTLGVGSEMVAEGQALFAEISVVPEGTIAAANGATAMHDITEGGILGALAELADASKIGFRVRVESIPRRPATDAICGFFGVDPLALVSSGSLLITAPKERDLVHILMHHGIRATSIGEVTAKDRRLLLRGKQMPHFAPERDELWRLLEERADFPR